MNSILGINILELNFHHTGKAQKIRSFIKQTPENIKEISSLIISPVNLDAVVRFHDNSESRVFRYSWRMAS